MPAAFAESDTLGTILPGTLPAAVSLGGVRPLFRTPPLYLPFGRLADELCPVLALLRSEITIVRSRRPLDSRLARLRAAHVWSPPPATVDQGEHQWNRSKL
jgi:hypothetical protein